MTHASDLGPSFESFFVGRDQEIGMLRSRLADAAAGRGGIVLMVGEPGIGKTRTVEAAAAWASDQGFRVLWGRCYEGEGAPALWPWIQILRAYARETETDTLRDQLGMGGAAIAQIVTELHQRLPQLPDPPPLGPAEARFRFFDSVAAFLRRAAHAQPMLLSLDDLQWSDTASLLLLGFLARELAAMPLLITVTYRDADVRAGGPLAQTLGELARWPHTGRLTLEGLTEGEITALLAATMGRSPSRDLVRQVATRTEGNPLFVIEMARLLVQASSGTAEGTDDLSATPSVPPTVRDVINRRLAGLPADVRTTLALAAVLGREFDLRVMSRATDLPAGRLLAALEEAEMAGLIRPAPDGDAGYRFAHVLIRDTLYDDLPGIGRMQLHRRAAEAMEESYAPALTKHLGAVAAHYRLAGAVGNTEKAIDYAIRAGDAAQAIGAWEEAVRQWDAALALTTRYGAAERKAPLLEKLGDVRFAAGLDYDKSRENLEEALALYEKADLLAQAANVHIRLGYNLTLYQPVQDVPRAGSHFLAAGRLLSGSGDAALELRLYLAIGQATAATWQLRADEGMRASRLAMEIAEQIGERGMWALAAGQCAHFHLFHGRLAEARVLAEQAWQAADQSRDGQATYFTTWSGHAPFAFLSDPIHGRPWLRRELEARRPDQTPVQRRHLLQHLSRDCTRLGEAQEARRVLVEAVALDRSFAVVDAELMPMDLDLVVLTGDAERAMSLWRRLDADGQRAGNVMNLCSNDLRMALLLRLEGDVVQAEIHLRSVLDAALAGPHVPFELHSRIELALLYAETHRPGEAEPHLARCRAVLDGGEDWRGLGGRAQLAEATVAAAKGRLDLAEPFFTAAIAAFQDLGLPWDEAEARALWGRELLTGGRSSSAAEQFDAAERIYRVVDAGSHWLRWIDRLRVHGPSRPAPAPSPARPGSLTAREVEVLRLLAAGVSNREIADALVVSVRTVEHHISRIYTKIGARGRVDATAYALRHGLSAPSGDEP